MEEIYRGARGGEGGGGHCHSSSITVSVHSSSMKSKPLEPSVKIEDEISIITSQGNLGHSQLCQTKSALKVHAGLPQHQVEEKPLSAWDHSCPSSPQGPQQHPNCPPTLKRNKLHDILKKYQKFVHNRCDRSKFCNFLAILTILTLLTL